MCSWRQKVKISSVNRLVPAITDPNWTKFWGVIEIRFIISLILMNYTKMIQGAPLTLWCGAIRLHQYKSTSWQTLNMYCQKATMGKSDKTASLKHNYKLQTHSITTYRVDIELRINHLTGWLKISLPMFSSWMATFSKAERLMTAAPLQRCLVNCLASGSVMDWTKPTIPE